MEYYLLTITHGSIQELELYPSLPLLQEHLALKCAIVEEISRDIITDPELIIDHYFSEHEDEFYSIIPLELRECSLKCEECGGIGGNHLQVCSYYL